MKLCTKQKLMSVHEETWFSALRVLEFGVTNWRYNRMIKTYSSVQLCGCIPVFTKYSKGAGWAGPSCPGPVPAEIQKGLCSYSIHHASLPPNTHSESSIKQPTEKTDHGCFHQNTWITKFSQHHTILLYAVIRYWNLSFSLSLSLSLSFFLSFFFLFLSLYLSPSFFLLSFFLYLKTNK